jgi:hypothetical protein
MIIFVYFSTMKAMHECFLSTYIDAYRESVLFAFFKFPFYHFILPNHVTTNISFDSCITYFFPSSIFIIFISF